MKKRLAILILTCLITASISCGCGESESSSTESVGMVSGTFKSLTYQIPGNWVCDMSDDGTCATYQPKNNSDDKFIIECQTTENDEMLRPKKSDLADVADSYGNRLDDYNLITGYETSVGEKEAYKFIYCFSDNGTSYYSHSFLLKADSDFYFISFVSKGERLTDWIESHEDDVINSVNAAEDTTAEKVTTKEPTTAEPTTEKPTEKATEFEDTLTELYSDDKITVYFSDVEKYGYSEDKVFVHFYIDNRTDKSLTFYTDTVILDGRSYNKVNSADPISANSSGMIEISVDDCTNLTPVSVGSDLRYRETDNYDSDRVKLNISEKSIK